jgi:flagellar biosynthesis regulator FlbT
MFIKTVSASEFRENIKDNLELVKDNNVLQVLHRGDGIKIVITQEHFFNILQKSRLFDDFENQHKDKGTLNQKTITKEELLKITKQKSKLKNDKIGS